MNKPFHHRVAHRIRKYHRSIVKYLYERDTIFATAWVFIFIFAVKVLPMPNLHFFDPIALALEDFDFNDIAYTSLGKGEKTLPDDRITVVNIGNADREGLAYIIDKVASMNPKVIGLDTYFEGPREPEKDSLLALVMAKTKNLVVASRINWGDGAHGHGHEIEGHMFEDYFDSLNLQKGFVNFIGREGSTMRTFSPYEEINHSIQYCFAAMLVKNYDSLAFQRLMKRHDHNETINYSRRTNQYQVVPLEQLLNGEFDQSVFANKIVLLGYVNDDTKDEVDKVITPMNAEFADKHSPDMNGIIVHANIISMILDREFVNKLPSWVNILVAILIGWLHMSFFIRYYLENHIWFHLVAKLAQLLSAIFFVWLGIIVFDRWNIKLNMSMSLVVIVLAVDIIYFYEAFAVWMHKKFGYHTVFHKPHH